MYCDILYTCPRYPYIRVYRLYDRTRQHKIITMFGSNVQCVYTCSHLQKCINYFLPGCLNFCMFPGDQHLFSAVTVLPVINVGQYTGIFSYSQYLIHTGMVDSNVDVIPVYQNNKKVLVYMCSSVSERLFNTSGHFCFKKRTYLSLKSSACLCV